MDMVRTVSHPEFIYRPTIEIFECSITYLISTAKEIEQVNTVALKKLPKWQDETASLITYAETEKNIGSFVMCRCQRLHGLLRLLLCNSDCRHKFISA